ncbi:hypothetical protein EVAR_40081_1 [Eumeta japonica]|uniref:Uncharacterized protein n=1 Tax=Eumeta variegata TaxID=151549 RepID=A0A4C1X324_EUMVA|nr:hypothetical protein EVAR_40081_1 [Eumeta japonica]
MSNGDGDILSVLKKYYPNQNSTDGVATNPIRPNNSASRSSVTNLLKDEAIFHRATLCMCNGHIQPRVKLLDNVTLRVSLCNDIRASNFASTEIIATVGSRFNNPNPRIPGSRDDSPGDDPGQEPIALDLCLINANEFETILNGPRPCDPS